MERIVREQDERHVTFPVTQSELEELHSRAKAAGMTLEAYNRVVHGFPSKKPR